GALGQMRLMEGAGQADKPAMHWLRRSWRFRTFDARLAAWIAFGTTLPVFLATMNRTIGFIDRGELAAVAWTFGIPHSTGYPTLMLLAGAVAHLIPLRPVLVLNGLAAML